MIRRVSALFSVCLLLLAFSHNLCAQVYPDREELDVVRLVDGTVLKGVILDQVPERYLEIQLYGGSTFVLGYEQIESVEREANPDYGTTWIKVELGALETQSGTPGGMEDDTPDARPRPLSAGGHVVSLYSFGAVDTFLVPMETGGWVTGWDDTFREMGTGRSFPDDSFDRKYHAAGIAYTWWNAIGDERPVPWVYGIRGTTGILTAVTESRSTFQDANPEDLFAYVRATVIPMVAEGLFGISGDRAALLIGLGLGPAIVAETVLEYEEDLPDGNVFEENRSLSVKHPITPLYSASLTGLFRLGRRWVLEAGLWANGQFVSAFDEGLVFRGWGERIAIGYRFGGK